jgi:hypothetical protein
MRRLATTAAILLALAGTPAFAQMINLSPAQIGEIFCIARVGNDMAPVEAILTPELSTEIAKAEAANDTIQKQFPDEKPPLGDGIPWQAYPDYAARCEAGDVTLARDESRTAVAYAFPEYPAANFTDILVLKLVADSEFAGEKVWRIDNVLYATGGDLRSALTGAFQAN